MIASRKDLANILNVSIEGLKKIEKRNQLEDRLLKQGYKIINKTKEAKKVYYELEVIKENKQLLNSICKQVFHTNKPNEFTSYFKQRTDNCKSDIPTTLQQLSNNNNVSIYTIHKWDLKLLDEKIISKDGYFYFKINKDTFTLEEVTKEEYKNFWKNKSKFRLRSQLHEKFYSGEISFDDALDIAENAAALKTEIEGKYLYRIKRYKLNEDNLLYIDIIKLIKD